MEPQARKRGLGFEQSLAADTPRWVRGDAVRLRQILLNLLGNAIKFTDQGEVSLRVEPHGDDVRAVVGDTGPGLNDEQKQRSEEHTSELQSLMRTSYAVFCLKKKKTILSMREHYEKPT